MTTITTPSDLRNVLHQELANIGNFSECALLDYPKYPNIGDHLIWLGTLFYLTDTLKTQIKYTASVWDFSAEKMEQRIGRDAPILLQGGGNMGDLWPIFQNFRERIVSQYKDRKIIILPQTIHFKDINNFKKAAEVFNAHPNLTIFARDSYSYKQAKEHFYNCRILQAPDMAFYMIGMPDLDFKIKPQNKILYHCRSDHEPFPPNAMNIPNLVQSDWVSYRWVHRESIKDSSEWYWKIPGTVRLYREFWQQGISHPLEWLSRYQWEKSNPNLTKLDNIYNAEFHRQSWRYMHFGIHQLKRHRVIVTNRTHGHISCIILGIPHVFSPGSYHKNESFYKTWTNQLPFCRWVTETSQVKPAVEELLEKFPNHVKVTQNSSSSPL